MNSNDVFACPTILTTSWEGTQHLETTTMQYTTNNELLWFQPKPSNQIAVFIQNVPKAMGSGVGCLEGNERRHHWHYFRAGLVRSSLLSRVCWGLDEESHLVFEMFEHWNQSNWKFAFGRCHGLTSCQAVGEFVFLEGICWDILFILT